VFRLFRCFRGGGHPPFRLTLLYLTNYRCLRNAPKHRSLIHPHPRNKGNTETNAAGAALFGTAPCKFILIIPLPRKDDMRFENYTA
jgi:hypothetical protein